eukprot:g2830.t1
MAPILGRPGLSRPGGAARDAKFDAMRDAPRNSPVSRSPMHMPMSRAAANSSGDLHNWASTLRYGQGPGSPGTRYRPLTAEEAEFALRAGEGDSEDQPNYMRATKSRARASAATQSFRAGTGGGKNMRNTDTGATSSSQAALRGTESMDVGDALLTIEHCHSCAEHAHFTRHDETQYIYHTQLVGEAVVEALPSVQVRHKFAALRGRRHQRQRPQQLPQSGRHGQHWQPLPHERQRASGRIGAFEVQLALKVLPHEIPVPLSAELADAQAQLRLHVLHSKILTNRWPVLPRLLRAILGRLPTVQIAHGVTMRAAHQYQCSLSPLAAQTVPPKRLRMKAKAGPAGDDTFASDSSSSSSGSEGDSDDFGSGSDLDSTYTSRSRQNFAPSASSTVTLSPSRSRRARVAAQRLHHLHKRRSAAAHDDSIDDEAVEPPDVALSLHTMNAKLDLVAESFERMRSRAAGGGDTDTIASQIPPQRSSTTILGVPSGEYQFCSALTATTRAGSMRYAVRAITDAPSVATRGTLTTDISAWPTHFSMAPPFLQSDHENNESSARNASTTDVSKARLCLVAEINTEGVLPRLGDGWNEVPKEMVDEKQQHKIGIEVNFKEDSTRGTKQQQKMTLILQQAISMLQVSHQKLGSYHGAFVLQ